MECCKHNRTSDVEENENRKVEDNQENSKHTQNREMIDTKKGKLPNNWKMVPLFVDKISFFIFIGLQIYLYFNYIPH